jgi:hypothetical protein
VVIRIPRAAREALEKQAREAGLGVAEYVIDLALQRIDPRESALGYLEAAEALADEAERELAHNNIRQAAEKVWGAVALAVKAYAAWREGRRLASHGELWEYTERMIEELGSWIATAWYAGHSMHACFYEGWCRRRHVEEALKHAKRLLKEVGSRVRQATSSSRLR